MRLELVMAILLGCTSSDGNGDRDPRNRDPDPPTGPACNPNLPDVDAIGFDIATYPQNALGRALTVTLAADAGAVVTCTLDEAPPIWRELVATNSDWRWSADDPAADFADPGFDDAAWEEAPGPFGREDEGATMILPDTLDAPPIVRFRTRFDVTDPAAIRSLTLGVRRDDGVVLWLNGTEIVRDNVPAVLKMSAGDERELFAFEIDPALLVAGENVLAAELHQSNGSTDAGFAVRLAAEVDEFLPETHLLYSEAPAKTHELSLYGLLADATYTCEARADTCGGASVPSTITTDPLPKSVRLATPPGLADPDAGYVLFNHSRPCSGDRTNRLFVADPDGRIRWYRELPINSPSSIDIEAQLMADGNIYWGGGDDPAGIPQMLSLDGETVYTASYPGIEEDNYHHDLALLPDGKLLGIIDSRAGDGVDSWSGFTLVEHDPATGEVTWRWDAQEAFDRGELAGPDEPDESDPWHANSLAYVEDGEGPAVYVSLFDTMEIIRVDRTTGHITWSLGAGRDFALLNSTAWFDRMHSIDVYPGPNGDRLFVYDNGNTRGETRALAFELDVAAKEATVAWEWTEPTWYEPNWGDADQTDDGTVFITMSHAHCLGGSLDHMGAFVEVDEATGEVVSRLDFLDQDDSTYRGQRIDGCDLFAIDRYCAPAQ